MVVFLLWIVNTLSYCTSVRLHVCVSVCVSTCVCICMCIYMCVYLYVYLHVCLSVWLYHVWLLAPWSPFHVCLSVAGCRHLLWYSPDMSNLNSFKPAQGVAAIFNYNTPSPIRVMCIHLNTEVVRKVQVTALTGCAKETYIHVLEAHNALYSTNRVCHKKCHACEKNLMKTLFF